MKQSQLRNLIKECLLEVLQEDRCWKGYKPVAGKEPYSKGSCEKKQKFEENIDNCLRFSSKKEALTYLKHNPFSCVGWEDKQASLWNGKLRIVPAKADYEWSDITEAGGSCNKPNTQKASSDRKDKKWTKCTNGKRIHWGDPNAKVTGKSGNTKRKKNFRARHNCSTAKPGTPRHAACQDWNVLKEC